jgi:hypothetical protein
MKSAAIQLTSGQKKNVTKVVKHDLNTRKRNLVGTGNIKLKLTKYQQLVIKTETGRSMKEIELTENDLRIYSSIACYEQGGVPVTP